MSTWGISNPTLFFGSLLVLVVLLWRAWSTRRVATQGDQVFRLLSAVCFAVLAGFSIPSVLAVQKWITRLVLPAGLLWLGLTVLVIVLYRRRMRGAAALAALVWLFLTLAGNEVVSSRLMASLEKDFARIDPLAVASRDDPFDLVLALGGSTSQTPGGQAQLTGAGDRVAVAARIYHAGHTRRLATSGESRPDLMEANRHPAEEVRTIWRGFGIPEDAILVLPGATTKGEFEVLAELVEERDWDRIGIVTSAWHMDRALRLAKAAGLEVEPLPSHFVGIVPPWRLTSIVPSEQALLETAQALKERLARFAGR